MQITETQQKALQNLMVTILKSGNDEEKQHLYYYMKGYFEGVGKAYGIDGSRKSTESIDGTQN
jgi:hypothetical protein